MILGSRYSAALFSKISDLKIRNREVSENENKYRALFENTNDGIAILKDEVFVFSNKRMSDIYNSGIDDFIGKTPVDFSPEYQPDGTESRIRMNEFIEKALNNEPQRFEWLYRQLDGKLSYAEVSLNKIILKGETLVQAIFRDISEKKQIERKILKAIVEAEEREREKFARELHDGLGPLCSTIKLYTQSAQVEDDSEAREKVLAIINDTINEAISSLSDISNSISPHILHNFGLISAVDAFVDNIKSTRKVTISCSSNTKERFQDIIEYTLYRVLVELVNNAIKNAVAKNITIKIEKADHSLKIFYSDDGKGAVPENISDKQKGLLNIQNRIRSLNGQISIDENKNRGMQVNILINLEDKESFNS
jgi:PAS domain S-box-containing protein